MSPIEQVRPAQPGNWVRRPEERKKRGDADKGRARAPQDKQRSGRDPGKGPDGHEHIVDELA